MHAKPTAQQQQPMTQTTTAALEREACLPLCFRGNFSAFVVVRETALGNVFLARERERQRCSVCCPLKIRTTAVLVQDRNKSRNNNHQQLQQIQQRHRHVPIIPCSPSLQLPFPCVHWHIADPSFAPIDPFSVLTCYIHLPTHVVLPIGPNELWLWRAMYGRLIRDTSETSKVVAFVERERERVRDLHSPQTRPGAPRPAFKSTNHHHHQDICQGTRDWELPPTVCPTLRACLSRGMFVLQSSFHFWKRRGVNFSVSPSLLTLCKSCPFLHLIRVAAKRKVF